MTLYGTTSAIYKNEKVEMIFGGGYNKYEGNHFGGNLGTARPQAKARSYYDDYAL
jgi:iron complex outermembrane receptor protein